MNCLVNNEAAVEARGGEDDAELRMEGVEEKQKRSVEGRRKGSGSL